MIYSIFDRVMPQTQTVARPDFPCAWHHCGCRTAEQCRRHCCCFPAAEAPRAVDRCGAAEPRQDNPTTVKVSSLAAAHCQGQSANDQGLASQSLAPHVLSSPVSVARHLKRVDAFSVNDLTPPSAQTRLPDKVPI